MGLDLCHVHVDLSQRLNGDWPFTPPFFILKNRYQSIICGFHIDFSKESTSIPPVISFVGESEIK